MKYTRYTYSLDQPDIEYRDSNHRADSSHRPRSHRRRHRRHGIRNVVIALLVILAGAAIMFYPQLTDLSYTWTQMRLNQQAGAMTLSAAASNGNGSKTASTPGSGAEGVVNSGIPLPEGAMALLEIPAIGLKTYVVEGTSGSALAQGPGHYPDTPLPGEAGNSCIAGHRTMYGHPFQDLDLLQPGDHVFTGTAAYKAMYTVKDILVVDPSQTDVVAQTGADLLTLTTCNPKGSAAQRLVVVAELNH